MGNILNHNRDIFQFDILKDDYWDFHLCIDDSYGALVDGLTERCLAAYIDINDSECVWFDEIFSKKDYVWENAINDGTLEFKNFGFTSVDNGKTYYELDRITNREFFDLYTKTIYKVNPDDFRLLLQKVRGNHKIYDYSNDIVIEDNMEVSKLNGGFYQGFFTANDGCEYKVLPTDIGNGWTLEFELKKEDFDNDKLTMNDIYPENKGIFFYIGTRAENKWWKKYTVDKEFPWCKKSGFADEYTDDKYIGYDSLNEDYFNKVIDLCEECNHSIDEYVVDGYIVKEEPVENSAFNDDYIVKEDRMEEMTCDKIEDKFCPNQQYFEDEYLEEDLKIDEEMDFKSETGFDFSQPNVKELETDNKFVIFDRTCDGFTVKTWNEGDAYVLSYIEHPQIDNYFTLMNRTCDGYDVCSIQKLIDIKSKEYDILKDLYRNALAFQIKDDGSVGYKYLVKNCDIEEDDYKIESEWSKPNMVKSEEWVNVQVRVLPVKHKIRDEHKGITNFYATDKMRLMFYVNGKLVLVSKELPILNLKKLNDSNDKQEGVPFNISLGGGTQGLSEVVYLNYRKPPEYSLPLEREFGGSFVGYFKSFKFYSCSLNYTELFNNHNFTAKQRYL